MRWFPWAAGTVGLLGAVAAAIFPGRSLGHINAKFVAFMTPPSNVNGGQATLTCGWHDSDGCRYGGSTALNALDWNNGISPYDGDVYFRGWFVLFDHPDAYNLTAMPREVHTGPNGCDIAAVEIWESSVNKKRAQMDYVHTTLTRRQNFGIKTGDYPGVYNNADIGYTADEKINGLPDPLCLWGGFHVHERGHKPDEPGTSEILNSLTYPQGDCEIIPPETECNWGTWQNDIFNNWTRQFDWIEEN